MTGHTSSPESMQGTAEAVMRTLLYGDVFDFPMTAREIHHFLIGSAATHTEVETVLRRSGWLAQRIECLNGYYVAQGRTETVALRQNRAQASARLWPVARRYGELVGRLPFVRMVAVTGALAMDNALPGDDIDFIIVTVPHRVWLARLFVVALVRLAHLFRVGLCPNYVLSETALLQPRRDLFTARELAQMVPLVGHDVYRAMRAANDWASAHLPNAEGPFRQEADARPRGFWWLLQRLAEWALGGRLGDWLEAWERRRKVAKFSHQVALPTAAAILDEERVKGHFEDYGAPTMRAYRQRLAAYDVAPADVDAIAVPLVDAEHG